MLPWASVATPTHPDDHANAPRSKYSLQKRRNRVYQKREICFTESEKYMLQNHHGAMGISCHTHPTRWSCQCWDWNTVYKKQEIWFTESEKYMLQYQRNISYRNITMGIICLTHSSRWSSQCQKQKNLDACDTPPPPTPLQILIQKKVWRWSELGRKWRPGM